MIDKIDLNIISQVLSLTEDQYKKFLEKLEPSQMNYLSYILEKYEKELG